MNELARQAWQRTTPSVRWIRCDGMTNRGEMHAQLVRSASQELRFDERPIAEPLTDPEVRLRQAPTTADRHALSVVEVASDWCVDQTLVFFDVAAHEQQVALLGRATLHLQLQIRGRSEGTTYHHQARGVFIEAMD